MDAANGLQQSDRTILALPVGDLGGAARVGRLVIGQSLHVVGHQPGAVDQPDAILRLLGGQPRAHHACVDLVGHAGSRGARAVNKEALVCEGPADGLHARDDSGDDDRSGALHVVIEDAVLVPVVDKDTARVRGAEVFEVQERARVELGCDPQVFIDEGIVAFSAHAAVAVAQVIGVVEQFLVVGADVEVDRDDARRVNTGCGRVDGELADGDVGAVHTPVTDAEDLFGVGDDQEVNVIGAAAEAFKRGPHILNSIDGQVDGARAAVVCGPFLDGLADGRIVDDG